MSGFTELNKEDFYEELSHTRRLDAAFSRPEDTELTEEEKKAIDAYWKRYSFAYPEIFYQIFQSYKNRSGKFDVHYLPGALRVKVMLPQFVPEQYGTAFQNKTLLPKLFPNTKQPKLYMCQMAGIYYRPGYQPISRDEAVALLLEAVQGGTELIVKTSGLGGGRGITFLNRDNDETSIRSILRQISGAAFVVQEVMKQSAFMAAFNPDSVNTMRITTFLFKGEFYILAALVRLGKPGSRLDNFSQGGTLLGFDAQTGLCQDWALTKSLEKIHVLPSGLDLQAQTLQIPNYDKVKAVLREMHYRIPYIRMVSWDIALDEQDEPVLIENNFAGEIQMHQSVTGPLFGEISDKVFDYYFLQSFCLPYRNENWLCDEYSDHIVLKEYIGSDRDARIPFVIADKPVTAVHVNAFKNKKAKLNSVTVTAQIRERSPKAFEGIKNVIVKG